MSDKTKIEWADATANYINGCTVVSPGCTNCYAMRLAGTRMKHHPSRAGLTIDTKAGPVWNGEVRRNERVLQEVLGWRKPRRIFWNAHGDMFHDSVPDSWIDAAFAVMALTPHHIHMVLTKRPARMREYLLTNGPDGQPREMCWATESTGRGWPDELIRVPSSPLPNVWLGTTIEDQTRADERIPTLAHWRDGTPAAVRFLSCEPLLEQVIICEHCARGHRPMMDARNDPRSKFHAGVGGFGDACGFNGIDWVIAGGESGPGARPMHPDWARSLRDQCAAADVPFHFKQWGEWAPGECATFAQTKTERTADLNYTNGYGWTYEDLTVAQSLQMHRDDQPDVFRLGKRAAGRLLDGLTHDGVPA